jgi:Matrixin
VLDSVLGCFNGPAGEITILQGWNWYAGADPTKINGAQYDFQSTVTHEFGHALGLGGATDPNSPMFETLAMGQAHRTMTVADLNLLEPPQGPDPERAAPPPWVEVYFLGNNTLAEQLATTSGDQQRDSLPLVTPRLGNARKQASLNTVLADWSWSDFSGMSTHLLKDTQSLLSRLSPPVDEPNEFWQSIAGSTLLDQITNLSQAANHR